MATDRELLRLSEKGRMGSVGLSDVETAVNKLNQRMMVVTPNAATATGSTASHTFGIAVLDRDIKLISARFIAPSAMTASATNYVTISVAKNDDAGGANTALASQATITAASGGTGTIAANQSVALTLQSTVTASSGQQLRVRYVNTSGGKSVPAGAKIVLVYQEI